MRKLSSLLTFTLVIFMQLFAWTITPSVFSSKNLENLSAPPSRLKISGFSPASLTAGTGAVLTITGSGFGDTKGLGGVYLRNANDGGNSMIFFEDNAYYKLWSNNEIQLIIPSFLHTDPDKLPGTGTITVKNDIGDVQITNDQLIIKYALNNQPFVSKPQLKGLLHLASDEPNGTIKFYVTADIAAIPEAVAVIKEAIFEWGCRTGANLVLATDVLGSPLVSNQSVAQFDHQNVITFSPDPLPALARTIHYRSECEVPGRGLTLISKEVDILINKATSWDFDFSGRALLANKSDFYAVILHELGHALGLEHVNSTQDLMYYEIPVAPRKNLTSADYGSTTWIKDAIADIYNRSTSLDLSHCKDLFKVAHSVDCGKDGFGMQEELVVYPNPGSTGEITLAIPVKKNIPVNVSLLDMTGRQIVVFSNYTDELGRIIWHSDFALLQSGLYVFRVEAEEKSYMVQWFKK